MTRLAVAVQKKYGGFAYSEENNSNPNLQALVRKTTLKFTKAENKAVINK
jgi:hypothetical protein